MASSSCVSSKLCLVVFLLLLVFLGFFQLGSCSPEDHLSKTFITWQDMKVDEGWGRFGIGNDFNISRVIVVSKDGRGDIDAVQGAIDMVPNHNRERVKIFIFPGIYREKVYVPRSKPFISLIGRRSNETVITWHNKASDKYDNGGEMGTYRSASVTIASDYFCATGITFENTIVAVPGGYGMQAVALRIAAEKAMFYRVRFVGAQDTLLDERGTHYFYQCYIEGTVDFIFGNARSLYKDCNIHSTAKRSGAIAASHRNSADENTGFSFVNCRINGTGDILLGRAWGPYSRAIFAFCYIGDIITPEGWSDWGYESRRETAVFGEYMCRGRGANSRKRVAWAKSFTYEEVLPFLGMNYIDGDEWLSLSLSSSFTQFPASSPSPTPSILPYPPFSSPSLTPSILPYPPNMGQ